MTFIAVKTVKDAWHHFRDAYRKKQLKATAGGAGGSRGGGGGCKKLGSAGDSREEVADRWRFYTQMSFYKPFIIQGCKEKSIFYDKNPAFIGKSHH